MSCPTPWGKHRPDGRSLSLRDHCIDVAAVFRALLDLPNFARWAPKHNAQQARLAVLAFLHDLGKSNWGFQAKGDPHARKTAGHVLEAVALLYELQNLWPPHWTRLLIEIAGWFRNEEQAMQALLASISHHGRPVSLNDYQNSSVHRTASMWWGPKGEYAPLAALDALSLAARQAFPDAFTDGTQPIDATPELQQRFAGLVMLADWIASDTQFFPYETPVGQTREVFSKAAAEKALRAIGLAPPSPRHSKPFQEIFSFVPTTLQAALASTIAAADDTRLLLVEADTGSGKTEAALAWFFRLYAQGRVDGLYFALPTRVAARELYGRVLRAVDAAFPPSSRPRPVLLAVPGYVQADGENHGQTLPDPDGTLWEDNPQDRRRERLWSAERPKRFLAAPVAVGTIDQALLSVLQVRHSLLRSVCLDRHLLVVDEVHASDPYMREILSTLLRKHQAAGGWALLLSATLGEAAAASYFGRDPIPFEAALRRSYPLVSSLEKLWPMPAVRTRRIDVECSPTLTDDAALVPRLLEALFAGARILVVCNTVDRANALFRTFEAQVTQYHPKCLSALFALNGVRCPHHGRFARADRERLDIAISAQLGKGSPAGPRLVIGTQTLEQSLDIDADWLITDLAPMDVLIQRFGRLHRHHRSPRPPGFETPRALVRIPEHDLSAYVMHDGALRAPAGLGSVYADGRVLALTLQSLQTQPELNLPAESRARIESTTHPERLLQLCEPWLSHGARIEGAELGEIRQALRSVVDDQPFGELHYADKSERILTRLGRPTYDIPLAERVVSPFGAMIERVAIPAHWLERQEPPEVIEPQKTSEGFAFTIGKTRFHYTRFGLEKADV